MRLATRMRGGMLLLALGVVAVGAVAPGFFPPFLLTVTMLALIYAILAMSLDILMGYTGLESLGQAAFFGLAAYTTGVLTAKYDVGWGVAVIVALVFGTLAAAITGLMAVRLGGLFFLVITLAFSQVFWGIANQWGEMTNGYQGLRGVERPYTGLNEDLNYYYVVLVVFVITVFLMWRLITSPFGLTLKGVRDSESRMQTSGYNTWLHKYIVFVICGAFAAVAGALYAYAQQFVTPDVLSITTSFDAMLMVIIGGVGSLFGPALGAAVIVALRNYLSSYLAHWYMVLGGLYIVTVMFAPQGLVGLIRGLRRTNPIAASEVETGVFGGGHVDDVSARRAPATPAPTGGQASSSAPALELMGVGKAFGTLQAVQDVSFTAGVGTRMAVIGPNGAGKTTLFNLISGLHKPTTGEISLLGNPITRVPAYRRAQMGLGRTYQVTNLYPTLTVLDNIRLGVMGLQSRKYAVHTSVKRLTDLNDRCKELLGAVGLWDFRDIEVRHLSYGHQRQLEIAMALASEPTVLLLDEPAAGLSLGETGRLVEVVNSLDPSLTLLIIEHDMDVAFELAREITVLHNGRMLAQGSREEIKANTAVRDVYLGGTFE